MTVESATYISDLDDTLPLASGPIGEGDDHLRLIKSTIQATFPNVAGAVTLTHAQINNAVQNDGDTLDGTLTFSDISYNIEWYMPTAFNPVSLSAIEYNDPVYHTTATGFRVGSAIMEMNYPPIQDLAAGIRIWNDSTDENQYGAVQWWDYTPSTGAQTLTATVGYVQDTGILVIQNQRTGGDIYLLAQTTGGEIVFANPTYNTNLTNILKSLVSIANAVKAEHPSRTIYNPLTGAAL